MAKEQKKSLVKEREMPRYQSSIERKLGKASFDRVHADFQQIHKRFLVLLDDYQLSNESLYQSYQLTEEHISEILDLLKLDYKPKEMAAIESLMKSEMLGFGTFDTLLDDDEISDILVNRFDEIFVEKAGQLALTRLRFYNDKHLMSVLHRILALSNRRVDRLMPYANARLSDGSRVNVIIPPATSKGPVVSIRRFSRHGITMDNMVDGGSTVQGIAKLLSLAVQCRCNMMIIGGAGAGKTTLLNAIAQNIDVNERLVTIEDVTELQIDHPHCVRLESQTESLEGIGAVTMRDLFLNALRMRPTRIIIGEVRGLEILEMLQAMNSGHDGSLTTLHASSPEDVPSRILNMVAMAGVNIPSSAVLTQIINNIDLIVEVQHLSSGQRIIKRVSECLTNVDNKYMLNHVYAYQSHQSIEGRLTVDYKTQPLTDHFKARVGEYDLVSALEELDDGIA